jgi:putative sulfotransferase
LDRFIVGTGRCGSTLLSKMMAENVRLLSIFEYFNGLDVVRRFAPEPVSGRDYADLISAEQPFLTAVLRRGYPVEEVLYPFADDPRTPPEDRGRYHREDPLPWILVGTIPRITSRPDELFDEVMAFANGLPEQPMRDHHRALFEWLTRRFERDYWVERAGGSIDYVGSLASEFPDARFVHIHRDGREVALSIREHHAFRLPVTVMYDAPTESGLRASELDDLNLHGAPAPDGSDPLSQIIASRPPVEFFGRYWHDQVQRGMQALGALDPARRLDVRFEELVMEPAAVLARIADFFELGGDRGWIARAAALSRGLPPTRFDRLRPDEQERLQAVCAPALELLNRRP